MALGKKWVLVGTAGVFYTYDYPMANGFDGYGMCCSSSGKLCLNIMKTHGGWLSSGFAVRGVTALPILMG